MLPLPKPPQEKKGFGLYVQRDLISDEAKKNSQYTSKIKAPIYEPKNKKPNVIELVNESKSKQLIKEISATSLPEDEKRFLFRAAFRHNVFNFRLIADYYAHSSSEMQLLMERSGLVIIDFNKAVENGYIKFSEEIAKLYVKEHGKTPE